MPTCFLTFNLCLFVRASFHRRRRRCHAHVCLYYLGGSNDGCHCCLSNESSLRSSCNLWLTMHMWWTTQSLLHGFMSCDADFLWRLFIWSCNTHGIFSIYVMCDVCVARWWWIDYQQIRIHHLSTNPSFMKVNRLLLFLFWFEDILARSFQISFKFPPCCCPGHGQTKMHYACAILNSKSYIRRCWPLHFSTYCVYFSALAIAKENNEYCSIY